jgi:hypothetical protein
MDWNTRAYLALTIRHNGRLSRLQCLLIDDASRRQRNKQRKAQCETDAPGLEMPPGDRKTAAGVHSSLGGRALVSRLCREPYRCLRSDTEFTCDRKGAAVLIDYLFDERQAKPRAEAFCAE